VQSTCTLERLGRSELRGFDDESQTVIADSSTTDVINNMFACTRLKVQEFKLVNVLTPLKITVDDGILVEVIQSSGSCLICGKVG